MFGRKNEVYCHVIDSATGIVYASSHDLMLAMQAERARDADNTVKNVAIKTLEKEADEAKKQSALTKKENDDLKKRVASYKREVELLYLQAIGNAKSVLGVKHIQKQYHKSEAYSEWASKTVYDIFCVSLQSIVNGKKAGSQIDQAAITKIKRINREAVIKKCQALNDETSDASYAMSMMALLKLVANIEVDGTKILNARKAGLTAIDVFRSMLAEYKVNQSDVM